MMTVMMMLMCVVYFQRARQEIIKVGGWVGLRKMEGKMGGSREKNEKISTTVKPERERELWVCTFWEKKGALCWQRLVFCVVLFSCSCSCSFSRFACTTWSACVYILERCWCSRSLFLCGLGRFSLYLDPVLFGVV